jgi:hypothetical protein
MMKDAVTVDHMSIIFIRLITMTHIKRWLIHSHRTQGPKTCPI